MIYQVGRACAVAGYTDLYHELPMILPEVHIAEEARECKKMAIYNLIMAQPKKYNLMNDYERTVSSIEEVGVQAGAFLNGDTAVRRLLEIKQRSMFQSKTISTTVFSTTVTNREPLISPRT